MNSLFIYLELYTNGHSVGSLDVVAIIALLSGILIIACQNPISSALFLICLFSGIAGYLILVGLNFIGLSYLLVYVGAVSILFIFILMLINVRRSELLSDLNYSLGLNLIISSTVYFAISFVIPFSLVSTVNFANNYIIPNLVLFIDVINKTNSFIIETHKLFWAGQPSMHVHFVTTGLWDGYLMVTSHITSIGNIIYTSYSIWLILASIILLLAMVGAIVITIKKK